MVDFCKKASIFETNFIQSPVEPSFSSSHPYTNKLSSGSFHYAALNLSVRTKEDNIHITKFSELIEMFQKTQNELMEVKTNTESTELGGGKLQKKADLWGQLSLGCFLKYLRETGKLDTYILLLFIAAGAGYPLVQLNIFQYLLGHDRVTLPIG